jgi:RNA polymerase sigma factor (sigma-70 family)
MARGPSAASLKHLNTLFQVGTVGGLTDGQLLDQYVQSRDETAFAALVDRHGPMVLRVCRSRLGDRHGAEDAFQATFLVLAQHARTIRKSEAVAGWLLGVAGRVSAKALSAARRRSIAEQQAGLSQDVATQETPPEPWAELYDELERLPERYRLPLVLCHLEGLTYEQAAVRLCCPVRTVQTRLARGRKRLRGRLARRGLAPTADLVPAAMSVHWQTLIVRVSLKEATVQAALRFANLKGAAAGASSVAVALTREVIRAMFLVKAVTTVTFLLLLGLIGVGGWLTWPKTGLREPQPALKQTVRLAPSAVARDQAGAPKADGRFQMTGFVRVEGTDEPVAGAKVQVDLGTIDLRGDMREALTDADGHYVIALPEGNGRPWILIPPPGYWLPDANKQRDFFAVTPQQPVYRKDYLVRRGSVWKFQLINGARRQPVQSGFVSSGFNVGKTDENGFATLTLPHEAGKATVHLRAENQIGRTGPATIDWEQGFRTDAVKTVERLVERGWTTRLRLSDDAGRSATIAGLTDAVASAGQLVIFALFPDATLQSTGTLTGTVVDQDGRPIADANVAIDFSLGQSLSARDEHRVRTNAEGRYALHSVPRLSDNGDPTKVSLVVYKDGFAGIDSQPFVFRPGGDGTQVAETLRLSPGASLSGTVVGPEDQPVVGALIETARGWSQGTRSYRSGPNGRFTIPNLSKGVIKIAFTFGKLTELRQYVVDGKKEELKVQLHAPPAAKPAAVAAKAAPRTSLTVGQSALEWHVRGWTDGKTRTLADFSGKVVFLEFWGIWCGSCVTSLPAIDRLREKFEPRGVVFLSIHTPGESMDKIRKLFDLKKVSLVSAIDEGQGDNTDSGTTFRAYAVNGCPVSVLIDNKGKIAFRSNDPANRPAVEALVKKLGIDPQGPLTEEKLNRLFEAANSEAIESVLAQK